MGKLGTGVSSLCTQVSLHSVVTTFCLVIIGLSRGAKSHRTGWAWRAWSRSLGTPRKQTAELLTLLESAGGGGLSSGMGISSPNCKRREMLQMKICKKQFPRQEMGTNGRVCGGERAS